MPSYSQTNRLLSITSTLGANVLLAMSFAGIEEISELFDYSANLATDINTTISPTELVGKRVTMELLVTLNGDKRYFNGIVASLEATGADTFFNYYRVRIVPTLWLLSLNQQTRVFQNKTVIEIVEEVLSPYSIVPAIETQGSYIPLEYCTQYRETDLEFISRILQQHGIFYYFTHTASDHIMMLCDTVSHLSNCPVTSEFKYGNRSEGNMNFFEPIINTFNSRSSLVTGEHTRWDYRFMPYSLSHASPQTVKASTAMGENSHEIYDYVDSASAYLKTEGGDATTQQLQTLLQNVDKEIAESHSVVCNGTSIASTLQTGFTFNMIQHPQADKNIKYLVTQVEHSIDQGLAYRSDGLFMVEEPYKNVFEARPFTQAYRKEKTLSKPRVNGVVTGKVVTNAGDDSYLDKYGRVCVQFWWDRNRPPNTPDNTLMRVAQQWAGKGWGTYFWPRIGDEVLIDFIDGDPDAPIVVGSVYNGINLPKYDPRSKYTRSGIITRSSKNGVAANANELRFEDLKGSEQIFMNAERDYDLHVEQDWHTLVGNEEHREVNKSQYHSIGGDAHLKIMQDQIVEVDGNRSETIQGNHIRTVQGNSVNKSTLSHASQTNGIHSINAVGQIQIISKSAGVIIDGGEAGIYLVSGESAISINPITGVTIQPFPKPGPATPIPPVPAPPVADSDAFVPPKWPGDDPRGA